MKAINEKIGLRGLYSSVLVFDEYLRFPVRVEAQDTLLTLQEKPNISRIARKTGGIPVCSCSNQAIYRVEGSVKQQWIVQTRRNVSDVEGETSEPPRW